MRWENLSTQQVDSLTRGLYPVLHYLSRLRKRINKAGFLPDDRLYQLVRQAYDAMLDLSQHVHRLSCKPGSRYNRKG